MTDGGRVFELATLVRRQDRERYLTVLFAPAERREALLALYAFNQEIAKTREVVREPTLGQIRLQWWREALEEIQAGGRQRRHEVVEPLAQAIRAHALPQPAFERLLVGRERDLDDAAFASLAELEAYASATSAELVLLALRVLGADGTGERGVEVGIGYALTGLLRAVPFHARQGRCLLPDAVLLAHGTGRGEVLAMKPSPRVSAAVAEIADRARMLLAPVRVQAAAWPALAPAVLARRHLRALRRSGHDVFDPRLAGEPGAGAVLALVSASLLHRA
jgi:phytoene synthase